MKKAFFTLSFVPLLFLSFALPVLAQDNPGDDGPDGPGNVPVSFQIKNPFAVGDNLFDLMESILTNIVMPIGGMLCVLAFIWSGFKFVTAQGNQTELTKAKNMLLYAAIGTAILLGALTIEMLVRTTFTSLLS